MHMHLIDVILYITKLKNYKKNFYSVQLIII